jgi:hypothetical protein
LIEVARDPADIFLAVHQNGYRWQLLNRFLDPRRRGSIQPDPDPVPNARAGVAGRPPFVLGNP